MAPEATEEIAPKAVELKVVDSVGGFAPAIDLNTTDPTVEEKKETVTKEVDITKSILDGIATEDKVVSVVPEEAPNGAVGEVGDQEQGTGSTSLEQGTDSSSQEQETGSSLQEPGPSVESGDLQESEVIKVDDLKRSNGTTKDGQYAVFGYVVENQELLGKLQVGDVIESMRVVSGIDNLVNPSYRI